MSRFILILVFASSVICIAASADVQPAAGVEAIDTPLDAGGSITVTWNASASEIDVGSVVTGYEVLRSEVPDADFEKVSEAEAGSTDYQFVDDTAKNGAEYYYIIKTTAKSGGSETASVGPVIASIQFFNPNRLNILIAAIILSGFVLIYIARARSGKDMFIRRIGGLDAVQEAVGRATEMGKPILYVPGIGELDDIQTIASVTILGRVATMVAEYDADLLVPCRSSLVMSTAQEVVKEAYLEAGRPDAYQAGNIRYLTDDQFGYVSGIDGIMLREKPAANFYLGTFYAESLILAETGHSIGAIQIAGTAMPSQLPFFIAACDYTLIGEELFAASAYLSREPRLMGSLLGQDWGKVIILTILLIGVITAVIAQFEGLEFLDIARFFAIQ
ncbi:MAG: fibronectin type III domain-containing protein [bacterium]|nr:fibronectin type III domain-containing protein [bacterium]